MSDPTLPPDQREFRCIHCNGKIRIPRNLPVTTGPCPHCSGLITSPAPEPEPLSPSPAPAQAAPPPPPPPAPTPAAEAPIAPPPSPEPRPSPSRQPSPSPSRPRKPLSPLAIILPICLVAILVLGIGTLVYFIAKEMEKKPSADLVRTPVTPVDNTLRENQYIRVGWQKEAYSVLDPFIAGRSVDQKLPHILGGEANRSRLDDFYGGSVIMDGDTPADAFTAYNLSEEDRRRGLFMMIYDQPPQFEMKEFFRPLASLEVQHGLDEVGLLLGSLARVGNFAMEPVLVHAFFKRTPEGLKLDWDVFAQTKYRTFRTFVELPDPGQSKIFRVLIFEDVPETGRAVPGTRTYRLADPTGTTDPSRVITDSARVNVPVDSEIGRILHVINWRGTESNRPVTRTATVELKWSDEEPSELLIERFLCWEFLGLGGGEEASGAASGR